MTSFEIAEELMTAYNELSFIEIEEDKQEILERINDLMEQAANKADGLYHMITKVESRVGAIDGEINRWVLEIARLKKKKQSCENLQARLSELVLLMVDANGGKIMSSGVEFYRKSGAKTLELPADALQRCVDQGLTEFLKIREAEPELDKQKIKDYLKNGNTLDFARLAPTSYLARR